MKDKKTLITIIVLLVIFLPIGLVGTIKHFSLPKQLDNGIENPDKEFIHNNKVYFYIGDKLMSTYECSTCSIADTVIDDSKYHTNYYKGDDLVLSGVINNFFSVFKKDNNYVLDMDLPGYEKEDIKAQLKDGYLTITAQKNTSNDDKDEKGNYIRRERYCGKCSRSFYVGDGIKEEDIKANFKNGILQLTFPKEVARKEDEETKYITID